jgi:hypothetical protein
MYLYFFTHFSYIITEKTTTVFLKKGKLILIALSKKKDTISHLNSNLEYLYIQVR